MAPAAAILGLGGTVLSEDDRAVLRSADPWGIILFSRNVHSPGQLRVLTADIRETMGRDVPVLIDQEGGRVQRLRAPYWRDYLPALDQMARARQPMRAQWVRNRLIAADLHAAGIDVNCVPVGDLAFGQTHPFLKNRTYGGDPATVAEAMRTAAEAHLAGGVLPVMKHIPGHGRATVDSHGAVPRVTTRPEELRDRDFVPFRRNAAIRMGMTAHVTYTAFDPWLPATLSPRMIRLVREDLGFDGLLMTDDIGMEALSGTLALRATAALSAGCDLVLFGNGDRAENEEVAGAAGAMSAAAEARAAAALAQRRAPGPVDIPALEAELSDLLGAA